jgi:hypothetical protein
MDGSKLSTPVERFGPARRLFVTQYPRISSVIHYAEQERKRPLTCCDTL